MAVITGTPGNDMLAGTAASAIISGLGRNDTAGTGSGVAGGNVGNDTLVGSGGKDIPNGAGDSDTIAGNGGHDQLLGETGEHLSGFGAGSLEDAFDDSCPLQTKNGVDILVQLDMDDSAGTEAGATVATVVAAPIAEIGFYYGSV